MIFFKNDFLKRLKEIVKEAKFLQMLIENNFSSLKAFNKRVLKGFYVSQSELDKVTVFKRSDVVVVQK